MLQLLKHFQKQSEVDVVATIKPSRVKNKKNIDSLLDHGKSEILFPVKFFKSETLYHGPDFKLNVCGSISKIVTIHDMVVFEEKYNRPEFYKKGMKEMSKVLCSGSLDAVIVNSVFTKTQVLRFFPDLQNKIHVTYLGCNRNFSELGQPSLDLPEKYILFLGTLEKRKNLLGIIHTFEILRAQGFQEKLVLAGAWGFGAEEIRLAIENSAAKEHIVYLNYVPQENLAELYQRAQVFFFPSWYEGFGIPVLEAMSLNTPVVTSSGGVLEEICGKAALLADPGNAEEMAEALKKVLLDKELRASLQKLGFERSQQFTWEKCARDTMNVYKKVLKI
ncbi:MAG: glycosyltransferase family 4 protein [Pseudobdellovibrionaceae bacterium]